MTEIPTVLKETQFQVKDMDTSFNLLDFINQIIQLLINPDSSLGAGFIAAVLAILFVFIITFLINYLWKSIQNIFWYLVEKLGTQKGFRQLALKKYLRSVKYTYGKVINIYLDKEETLDLQRVFVPLTFRSITQEFTGSQDARSILTDPNQSRLMILGDPGSGKTTLLKALTSGVSRRQWLEFNEHIPIFVSLSSFAVKASNMSLMDYLCNNILTVLHLPKGKNLLENLLAKGQILLLLDGLDEISEQDLEVVTNALQDFLMLYDQQQQNRIILTCREQNYDLLPDIGLFRRLQFREYRLSDLRDTEMEAMIFNQQFPIQIF